MVIIHRIRISFIFFFSYNQPTCRLKTISYLAIMYLFETTMNYEENMKIQVIYWLWFLIELLRDYEITLILNIFTIFQTDDTLLFTVMNALDVIKAIYFLHNSLQIIHLFVGLALMLFESIIILTFAETNSFDHKTVPNIGRYWLK